MEFDFYTETCTEIKNKNPCTHNSSWVGLFWMIMLLYCRWLARTTKPLEIWYGTWYTVRITSPTLIKPGKWIQWVGRHTHTFSYRSLAGHSSARLCYNSFYCLLNDRKYLLRLQFLAFFVSEVNWTWYNEWERLVLL